MDTSSIDSSDVWVLGGGITGLSTAIVLQSLGFRVSIITEQQASQLGDQTDCPKLATNYAMASAYPHNLNVANLNEVSAISQTVFAHLRDDDRSAVSLYRIFELFEDEPTAPPALGDQRLNLQYLQGSPSELKRYFDAPVRPEATQLWGWQFASYFADMPIYLKFLWDNFLAADGKVFTTKITRENIEAWSTSKTLINCLGIDAVDLFGDQAPSVIMRGRQGQVGNAPSVKTFDGIPCAYNYWPKAELFPRADGTAEYLHFFPRSDGWVLGQTREVGQIDQNGIWQGDSVKCPEIALPSGSIPAPIFELNAAILKAWRGIDLSIGDIKARQGLRYYRDPFATGVRLEPQKLSASNWIFHNYGHGGSGITMSWGCAAKCVTQVVEKLGLPEQAILSEDALAKHLREAVNSTCCKAK